MVRIPDDYIVELKQNYLTLRDQYIALRDAPFNQGTAPAWHNAALSLLLDIHDNLILPMKDALDDMLELRAALERQHAAEEDGNSSQIYLERRAVKKLVMNGRGVTTRIRDWVAAHATDPGWKDKVIALLDQLDGEA